MSICVTLENEMDAFYGLDGCYCVTARIQTATPSEFEIWEAINSNPLGASYTPEQGYEITDWYIY